MDWVDVALSQHDELAGQLGSHREAVTLIEKDAAMRTAGRGNVQVCPARLQALLDQAGEA